MLSSCDTIDLVPQIQDAFNQDVIGDALDVGDDYEYESVDTDNRHRPPRINDCFELVYPVTVNFPDGSTATADSAQQLRRILHEWRQTHDSAQGRPQIAMPYDVMLSDGSTATITDRSDLRDIVRDCRQNGPRPPMGVRDCYRILFPVTVVLPRGDSVVVDSAQALRRLLHRWIHQHDSAVDGRPRLAFPYEVELPDGTVVTVENEEDQLALRRDCRGHRHPAIFGVPNCFRLVFPVTVKLPNGDRHEVDGPQALHRLLHAWYEHHGPRDGHPILVFPYEVELRGGRIVTIENRRQQLRLLHFCRCHRTGRCTDWDHTDFTD
ncbi:MAG: hypothetical protein D6730_02810 [Bacteroidetes bacterium]|nr:MAG: hypothetical protein D6730_02810 [Bacteroidota bacterium]